MIRVTDGCAFSASFSLPKGSKKNDKPYAQNKTAIVLAPNLLEATERLLDIYEDAVIHGMHRHGGPEVIFEDEELGEDEAPRPGGAT